MSKLVRLLMFCWAFPATLVGFVFAALLDVILGWCTYLGKKGDALVWCINDRAPLWVSGALGWHNALVIGNVVVLRHFIDDERSAMLLRHEQEHVLQWMMYGPFMLPAYVGCWLVLLVARHAHHVYDHPMEIDARRAAGQIIDVVGALKRLAEQGKLHIRHVKKPHE